MKTQKHKALPLCQKCQFYKVTWDSSQPHACLFFGFQSCLLPAIEVYNSTGMACPQYRLSEVQRREHRFQDCNDLSETLGKAKSLPKGSVGLLGQILGERGILL